MGIFDSYREGFTTNMLGEDKRTAAQKEAEGGRFFQALGAAAANMRGGRRPQQASGQVPFDQAYNTMQQKASQTPNGQPAPDGPMPAPSPLQRMITEARMMMSSGNPELQAAGTSMLQKYHDKQTKGTEAPKRGASYVKATDAGFTPETKEHRDYQKKLNTKAKLFAEPRYSVSDAKSITTLDGKPIPPGALVSDYAGNVQTKASTTDTKDVAKVESIDSSIAEIEKIMSGGGLDDLTQLEGIVTEARSGGGMFANAADAILNMANVEKNPDAIKYLSTIKSVNSNLLNLLSGASATEDEFNRVKSQLPQIGQDKETMAANLEATKRNFEIYKNKYNDMRGISIGYNDQSDGPKPGLKWAD